MKREHFFSFFTIIITKYSNFNYVEDAKFVTGMLKAIGSCEGEIKESQMDVVTALAGSGPAYVINIFAILF